MPTAVDPEVLEDLKTVAKSCTFFEAMDSAVEFWEVLCLVKEARGLMQQEIARLSMMGAQTRAKGYASTVMDRLRAIRDQHGPLVARLRKFLPSVPGIPPELDRVEMMIGFIMVSGRGREAVQRWVESPDTSAQQAGDKLGVMTNISDTYRSALEPWRPPLPKGAAPARKEPPPPEPEPAAAGLETAVFLEAVPPPAPETPLPAPPPAPPAAPPGPALAPDVAAVPVLPKDVPASISPETVSVILPSGVDLEVLSDVRRVEQCRKIFESTHQEIEVWEVFMLVMTDRDATRTKVEALLQLKAQGKAREFNDGAIALFEELLKLRAKYLRFVKSLREFLGKLPIGTFGKETTEMALGFIMASARGRERSQQWLDNPDRFRMEAAGRWEDIISRTMKYQTALRMVPG